MGSTIRKLKGKFIKGIKDWYWDAENLKQRLFQVVIQIGAIVAFISLFETFLVTDSVYLWVMCLVLFGLILLSLWMCLVRKKTRLISTLLAILLNIILFPSLFLFGGGLQGGATIWFLLGYFYIFLMYDGWKFWSSLLVTIVVDVGVYGYAFHHPTALAAPKNLPSAYMDSLFSVLVVGIATGVLLRVEMRLYDEERKISMKRNQELERQARARSSFFAGMSHEIRTPVNSIIGLNELILRENPSEQIVEYASNIEDSSEMLMALLGDVLDFAKLESHKLEIVPMEYSTKNLFMNLYNMVKTQAAKKNLELKMNVDTLFPAVLFGDEKRIVQILLNLLNNAVKYTEKGSIELEATGEKLENGTYQMRISVSDTGIGIKKENLATIYDSFRKSAKETQGWLEGNGLGLSIVKELVELMDGTIKLDSVYTKGSVFTVTLPQKVVEHTPVGVIRFGETAGKHNYEYHQKFEAPEARILIVDDNRMNSMVTSRLLAATRMQIYSAMSGKECLELTRRKFFHVILMDYMMPDMDGVETMREIRRQENGLCKESPIIAVTTMTREEAEAADVEVGFDGYLEKPIRSEVLESEILNHLPQEIVIYKKEKIDNSLTDKNGASVRRRKKVRITTDCVSDLPKEMVEKYGIHVMNLYIRTDKGRFIDSVEIDSDNMSDYIRNEKVHMDSCSVEEFETFFADNLMEAIDVIHISMASNAGVTYSRALEAARGFDYVHVYDSENISAGEALLVLEAARLASFGKSVDEIIEALDHYKPVVDNGFVMHDLDQFSMQGYTKRSLAHLARTFHLHPVMKMKRKTIAVSSFMTGEKEHLWRKYISMRLHKTRRIDPRVIIVSFAGCTSFQRNFVMEEISKRINFESVIVCKSSFSSAVGSGEGTFGIAFFEKI